MSDPTITVRIKGDQSQLNAELQKSQQGVMGFASNLKNLAASIGAAFSVRAVANFASQLMRDADAIVTYADGIGESVKNVVALRKAAGESGVETEKMLNWLQRIAEAQDKIGRDGGMSSLAKALEYAGVNVERFMSLKPADAFIELTSAARTSGQGVAALNEVLGRMAASDAMDVSKIIEAAGGWDKYAASLQKTADATTRLAAAQDRVDVFWQGLKENATIALDVVVQSLQNAWERIKSGNFFGISDQEILGQLIKNSPGNPNALSSPSSSPASDGPNAEGRAAIEKMREQYEDKTYFDAELARMRAANPMDTFNERKQAQRDYEKMLTTSDNPEFVKKFERYLDLLNKVVEENDKAAQKLFEDTIQKNARLVDVNNRRDQDIASVRATYDQAVSNIRVDLPRLSGIESMGAILGGTGGYANAMVQRQQKMIEIQEKLDASLAEIKLSTAEAAAALRGE